MKGLRYLFFVLFLLVCEPLSTEDVILSEPPSSRTDTLYNNLEITLVWSADENASLYLLQIFKEDKKLWYLKIL